MSNSVDCCRNPIKWVRCNCESIKDAIAAVATLQAEVLVLQGQVEVLEAQAADFEDRITALEAP